MFDIPKMSIGVEIPHCTLVNRVTSNAHKQCPTWANKVYQWTSSNGRESKDTVENSIANVGHGDRRSTPSTGTQELRRLVSLEVKPNSGDDLQ